MVNRSILVGAAIAALTGSGCVPARSTTPVAASSLAAAPSSAAATTSNPEPGTPRERPELNEYFNIKPVRRRVTERVLRALQLLPADATRTPNE